MSSNEHKNAHSDDDNMHEVKGFPSASNNNFYLRDLRGRSTFQRSYRLENALASVNGYDTPTTEVNLDVYIVESLALDCNAITWQSGTTVRFTFTSGYTNIYATGNYLQVADAANVVHNGVFLISAINASYLEVTIADVTDATDDVASGSTGNAYVTHEDYDPENLANGQSIPRQGMVKYYSDVDLWFGDAFQTGDEIFNVATGSYVNYEGSAVATTPQILLFERSLTPTEIKSMNTTPIELIATPGAGKAIVVKTAVGFLDHAGSDYAAGGVVWLTYGGDEMHTLVSAIITSTGDRYGRFVNIESNAGGFINEALELTNDSADFTTGEGTFKIKITYYIADFN